MKYKKFVTDNAVALNHPNINDCLIYDIETNGLDINNAEVKFVGFYSYKRGKYLLFHIDEREEIQQLIDEHKVLIGFNNKWFDSPIMENNGFNLQYKIVFDCLAVLYDYNRKKGNREAIIKLKDGRHLSHALPNRKLRTIAKVLKFPVAKGDINYEIFKKNVWTSDELTEIYKYLYFDVDITRRLFEFYVDYFDGFRELVDDENIRKFNYIRSSAGSFAYSAICYLADIKPTYEDDPLIKSKKPENHGGFVLLPQVEYAEGTIIYADFASLYPHIMFQCNLFSPCENGWNGNGFFELQSSYKNDKLGKIETILKDLYMKRRELKKNKDPRELGIKIILNSIYGISGSPIFKQVFNMTTAGDTTSIGRKMIQYTADEFARHKYKTLYGDTDSCFIQLPPNHTIEDFEKIATRTIEKLKTQLPFPVDTFKLEIDDIFIKLWLFGKKNYAAFNKDGKLIIKGLPIIKHDASQLGQKILIKIKPIMIESQNIKFEKEYFKKIIDEEIKNDITLIGRLYNVRSVNDYKSATSIQCQIAEKLGEGSHILIPNKTLGEIGKSKKYCTIEESKELTLDDLFLNKVWKELEPFIKCNN